MTTTERLPKTPYSLRLPASALEVMRRYAKAKGVTESAIAREAIQAGLVVVAGNVALEAGDVASGSGSGIGDGFMGADGKNHASD